MKRKNIKNVVLATVLAAGLGMTGITAMAQAAKASQIQDTCSNGHSDWKTISVETYYEEVSHINHDKYTRTEKVCRKCAEGAIDWEITLEDHTLRMAPWGNIWECIYCEYFE